MINFACYRSGKIEHNPIQKPVCIFDFSPSMQILLIVDENTLILLQCQMDWFYQTDIML